MRQLGLGLNLSPEKTRRREFLEKLERVAPWGVRVQIVARSVAFARFEPAEHLNHLSVAAAESVV